MREDERVFWIDAQLPPAIAPWIGETLGAKAHALKELRLRDAEDKEIFEAARRPGLVLMSKDSDFVGLTQRFGPPPQLLWVTCGNVTNARLKQILGAVWPQAMSMLDAGEPIVEIGAVSI